ncbi:MAG: leucyl/phenylalanyl-tRNA--protein transferase [Candidatus Puniceispirillales bacterium]
MHALSPETLIKAYALGVFPMAERHDDERIFFIDPDMRGVLPITGAAIPRRLRRKVRQRPFDVTINTAFDAVIDGCRSLTESRSESWINPPIRQLYCALHRLGFGHSIEVWDTDETGQRLLVGGLYGVALAGAFFGESMFSRATDASKIALVHLLARLHAGGFTLLDTQFTSPHLEQFGVREIPREDFQQKLQQALAVDARMPLEADDQSLVHSFLQDRTEIS